MGYWRDTHLKVVGSAAYELQHRFSFGLAGQFNEELLIDDTKLNQYFPVIPQKSGRVFKLSPAVPTTSTSRLSRVSCG